MDCLPRQIKVAVVERWLLVQVRLYCHQPLHVLTHTFDSQAWKTADISRRHHWFPRQTTSEKRAQKFLRQIFSQSAETLPRSGQSVASYKYGISALVSQTSLHGETSGGVAKCQLFCLFSQVFCRLVENFFHYLSKLRPAGCLYLHIYFLSFSLSEVISNLRWIFRPHLS